jgi:hypothetical protein
MYLQDLITCNKITISKNWSQIQTPQIAITFYYRIVDGHTEFPHCMLLFDKSNKRSTQLETAVIKIELKYDECL